jgi:peroxiredoxin
MAAGDSRPTIAKPMNGTRHSSMAFYTRRPVVLLALAAVIIVSLCLYKVTRTYDSMSASHDQLRPAPLCTLYNQQSQLIRLERYIGRHPILLVFFDGQQGADHDQVLQRATALSKQLAQSDVIVIGISHVIPQINRQSLDRLHHNLGREQGARSPLQLLSDLDFTVHRQWQRYQADRPQPAAFLIDRAGRVAWQSGAPRPLLDPLQTLNQLLRL